MAVVNSICLTQTGCNKIIITDTSEWDTVIPLIDIDTTTVNITYGTEVYEMSVTDYQSEVEILASLFGWTKLKDGKYDIKLIYGKEGSPGSMSFSLDTQPTLGTFSNFYHTSNSGTYYTNQWYFNSGMIGANTTETAANMVNYANSHFNLIGDTTNLIATSIGNVITFTTITNSNFYNNHGHFYVENTQIIDGSHAIGLFTSITGDESTDQNGDKYMFISGGATSNIYSIEEEAFIICNLQCIVDTLIANVAISDCRDCIKEKRSLALEATLKLDALEAAIACGNLVKAQMILDWMNDLLINYKCKNC